MRNIKLTIAYDGTNYHGWQKTNNKPSIEGALEKALEKILQHQVILQAASRTDAGVHANGQIVNFLTFREQLKLSSLKTRLNQLLNLDVRILSVEEMDPQFHPTLLCKEKVYHYYICRTQTQIPSKRLYSWHCPFLKDLTAIRDVLPQFIGKKDFSSFCNVKNESYIDHIREVSDISLVELENQQLCFKIKGQNFLFRMVRNIVGTLAYVGMGKISADQISSIIKAQDRKKAGITAPAYGLFLDHIIY